MNRCRTAAVMVLAFLGGCRGERPGADAGLPGDAGLPDDAMVPPTDASADAGGDACAGRDLMFALFDYTIGCQGDATCTPITRHFGAESDIEISCTYHSALGNYDLSMFRTDSLTGLRYGVEMALSREVSHVVVVEGIERLESDAVYAQNPRVGYSCEVNELLWGGSSVPGLPQVHATILCGTQTDPAIGLMGAPGGLRDLYKPDSYDFSSPALGAELIIAGCVGVDGAGAPIETGGDLCTECPRLPPVWPSQRDGRSDPRFTHCSQCAYSCSPLLASECSAEGCTCGTDGYCSSAANEQCVMVGDSWMCVPV